MAGSETPATQAGIAITKAIRILNTIFAASLPLSNHAEVSRI
jgi:hypothetical protein